MRAASRGDAVRAGARAAARLVLWARQAGPLMPQLLSTAMRLLVAVYVVKLTATLLGPGGVGLIGQFGSILSVLSSIAGGGIAQGILERIGGAGGRDPQSLRSTLDSAHGWGLLACSAVALFMIAGLEPLAAWLLPIRSGPALLLAATLGLYPLFHASTLAALLNGHGHQSRAAVAGLLTGAFTACTVTVGTLGAGLEGALAGMLAGALSPWLFLGLAARGALPGLKTSGGPRWVSADLPHWARHSALTAVTAISMPCAQMLLRTQWAAEAGWSPIGVWQGMVRLSDAYQQFFMVILATHYLPRLTLAGSLDERLLVMKRYATVLLPLMLLVCVAIHAERSLLVRLLFSDHFSEMEDLFLPQLTGDLARMCGYLIGCAILASGWLRLAMAAELIQAVLFGLMASRLGIAAGPTGVAWSYAATYLAYLPLVGLGLWWVVRRRKAAAVPAPAGSGT